MLRSQCVGLSYLIRKTALTHESCFLILPGRLQCSQSLCIFAHFPVLLYIPRKSAINKKITAHYAR